MRCFLCKPTDGCLTLNEREYEWWKQSEADVGDAERNTGGKKYSYRKGNVRESR